ncbi:hypothetical protein [Arthrobacter antioxidans]|uniref:hypothetical protein n=1 Tax=Arthrobacter antioxidans TaxID=2895818 RepID=UPI001FFE4F24|nr:hypothetical protein [Arthrobacter antioxidans]
MEGKIHWNLTARIAGDHDISVAGLHAMSAYERMKIRLTSGDTDVIVKLAPIPTLLLVSASSYRSQGDQTLRITLKINSAGDPLEFDTPLVLIGKPALDRFSGGGLTEFSFTSTLAQDVVIDILTARDSTTEP